MLNNLTRKNYWFIILPLFIAALLKPLPAFHESLGPRVISYIPNLIIGINYYLIILTMIFGITFLFISFRKRRFSEIPILSLPQKVLIVLKIFLLINSLTKTDSYSWFYEDALSLLIIFFLCFFVQQIGIMRHSYNSLLDVLFVVACIFLFINLYEMITNINAVSFSGRYFGLTVQPNTIGVYSAVFAVISLRMAHMTSDRNLKLLSILMIAIAIFMVLASASRASLAVLIIGCLVFMAPKLTFKHFFQIVIFLVGTGVLTLGIFYDSAVEYFNFNRLMSTTDTREVTKIIFWNAFLSSPFFGVGNFTESTANSYFVIMVKGGIVAAALLTSAIGVVFLNISKRMSLFFNDGDFRCFVALFIMLTAGGFYEGYLIDNFSFTSVFYMVLLGIISHNNAYIK